jgi:hypothetical protein
MIRDNPKQNQKLKKKRKNTPKHPYKTLQKERSVLKIKI